MSESPESPNRSLDSAVSRALTENLAPLQRSAEEFQQAYADFIASCSSGKAADTLPTILRAQWAAAAVSTGLTVLSNFLTTALHQRDLNASVAKILSSQAPVVEPRTDGGSPTASVETAPAPTANASHVAQQEIPISETPASYATRADTPLPESLTMEAPSAHGQTVETPLFDVAGFIASLPTDQQDLHRRANRVAKVTMQDIKLLKPGDVQQGREHKDLCVRLRSDLDKARREYDRRFKTILEHPVDYFHFWMVEILAEGRGEALGEYPYPSPVLRR